MPDNIHVKVYFSVSVLYRNRLHKLLCNHKVRNSVDFPTLILKIPIYGRNRSEGGRLPLAPHTPSSISPKRATIHTRHLHHLLFIVLFTLHVLLILIFLMALYVRLFLNESSSSQEEAQTFVGLAVKAEGPWMCLLLSFCIITYKIFIEKVPFIAIPCVTATFATRGKKTPHTHGVNVKI